MNDALRRKYEQLCELRLKGTVSDVEAKHRSATIVLGIKSDPQKYGGRAVEQLATALRVDKSLLYKEVRVVETWRTLAEVKKLVGAREDGLVSWTHLVTLATVTDKAKRDAAFNAVVTKGLTVAELQEHLHPGVVDPVPEPTSQGGLGLSRAIGHIESLKSQYGRVGKEVLDALAGVDVKNVGQDDIDDLRKLATLLPEVMSALSLSLDRAWEVLNQVEPPKISTARVGTFECAPA